MAEKAPATPADFKLLIVEEDETFCSALKKLAKMGILIWKMAKFKWQESGTVTTRYRAMVCAIDCRPPAPDTTASTTSTNPPT